jgi:multicomponent Na+:H+ antiporter subunit D
MPLTTIFCCIGAASISAFPLFSGFVTKSMVLVAAAEGHHTTTFLVLLFASAGVFHHSGIKIPYFAFFAHDRGLRPKEAPTNMLLAMAIAATLCIGIGCLPHLLYNLLPFPVQGFQAYDTTHIVTQSQLLFYSALAFVFLQRTRLYPPELPATNLDAEYLYRRVGRTLALSTFTTITTLSTTIRRSLTTHLNRHLTTLTNLHQPDHGAFGEPWTLGTAAIWAACALAAFALLGLL